MAQRTAGLHIEKHFRASCDNSAYLSLITDYWLSHYRPAWFADARPPFRPSQIVAEIALSLPNNKSKKLNVKKRLPCSWDNDFLAKLFSWKFRCVRPDAPLSTGLCKKNRANARTALSRTSREMIAWLVIV